jgi:hypothetical protein
MPKRALIAVVVLGLVGLAPAAAAQAPSEPLDLAGTWAGTWWMGKYEEPAELVLAQDGARLSGTVALAGDAIADPRTVVERVTVTGEVAGRRARLQWTVVGRSTFTAELTLSPSGVLMGVGGDVHGLTTGFTLMRVR